MTFHLAPQLLTFNDAHHGINLMFRVDAKAVADQLAS